MRNEKFVKRTALSILIATLSISCMGCGKKNPDATKEKNTEMTSQNTSAAEASTKYTSVENASSENVEVLAAEESGTKSDGDVNTSAPNSDTNAVQPEKEAPAEKPAVEAGGSPADAPAQTPEQPEYQPPAEEPSVETPAETPEEIPTEVPEEDLGYTWGIYTNLSAYVQMHGYLFKDTRFYQLPYTYFIDETKTAYLCIMKYEDALMYGHNRGYLTNGYSPNVQELVDYARSQGFSCRRVSVENCDSPFKYNGENYAVVSVCR